MLTTVQQAFPWELYNTRDYYCISAVSVHVILFYLVRDLRLVTHASTKREYARGVILDYAALLHVFKAYGTS